MSKVAVTQMSLTGIHALLSGYVRESPRQFQVNRIPGPQTIRIIALQPQHAFVGASTRRFGDQQTRRTRLGLDMTDKDASSADKLAYITEIFVTSSAVRAQLEM